MNNVVGSLPKWLGEKDANCPSLDYHDGIRHRNGSLGIYSIEMAVKNVLEFVVIE